MEFTPAQLEVLQQDILRLYDNEEYWNLELLEGICPHDGSQLGARMFDVDGNNLVERKVCPECGYGTPALL